MGIENWELNINGLLSGQGRPLLTTLVRAMGGPLLLVGRNNEPKSTRVTHRLQAAEAVISLITHHCFFAASWARFSSARAPASVLARP
jgi:hypothetical protein